jgi:hypothetical protein
MMTNVISPHRQGRDGRDPGRSLEIGREQLKAAPRRTRSLVDRETEAPIAISAPIPRETSVTA